MKILKWTAVIIVVLVAAFFAIGLITPEFSYENKVTVNAPVEKSFSVVMDSSKTREWMPTLKSIEMISGTPLQIGSKWKLTFDENGELMELFEEITDIQPNERFAFNMETEPFLGAVDIRFTAIDSTTSEIQATTTVNGKGMAWKSIMALSKSMIKSRAQEQYEMLKKVIETN